jgi:hypothetical protein
MGVVDGKGYGRFVSCHQDGGAPLVEGMWERLIGRHELHPGIIPLWWAILKRLKMV